MAQKEGASAPDPPSPASKSPTSASEACAMPDAFVTVLGKTMTVVRCLCTNPGGEVRDGVRLPRGMMFATLPG
jgi:hypothetical protein